MAQAMLRHMLEKERIPNFEILSRGVNAMSGSLLSEGAREALTKAHFPVPVHSAQRLLAADVERADWIYTMTRAHLAALMTSYPKAGSKAQTLSSSDIEDPIGGSLSDYEKCRIEIQNALLDLISNFKREGSRPS